MTSWGRSHRLPFAIAAVLVVLLAALATLQWRWIGEVSAMERQRMRAGLLSAGSRLAEDFDREVTRAYLYFHPDVPAFAEPAWDPLERVARQHARWVEEAPYPGLVGAVYVARPGEGGEQPSLAVLRPAERRFAPVPWPAELVGIRRRLAEAGDSPRLSARAFGAGRAVAAEAPALVIPLSFPSRGNRGDRSRRGSLEGRDEADPWAGAHLVLRLDERAMAREILPALTRRHFGSAKGVDYAVAVADAAGRIVYRSDPSMPAAGLREADVRLEMLRLRPFEELRSLWAGGGGRGSRVPRRHFAALWSGLRSPRSEGRPRAPGWTLAIQRRDGSLEEAVAAIRRRNLAVSLGILGLLAATVAVMVVTTQRAQRLARQQIEFVAGVTHELHTPLTAIRSAGANLADGVVAEPAQVKRYGALIDREGRRLSNMVGQILELAGIQSGRRVYRLEPTAVGEILEEALRDSRWLLEQGKIEVEKDIAPGLPPVMADTAALQRAVGNLIENAVKYGGGARWLGISARPGPDGGVEVAVADRGPGISREDLPHLFEPFFRGRDAAAGGVPGSGLGLSLVRHIVEAHGGGVTVDAIGASGAGDGTVFTLRLPAAPPSPAGDSAAEPA